MARQKEFDQDIALDKAVALFWHKGYAATSIQDLVEHMGIGRRSLYDTFSSKHDLFLAALDRYLAQANQMLSSTDAGVGSPKAKIRAIFDMIIAEAMADGDRKGCFFVNSAVELAGQDDAVTQRSYEGYGDLEVIFFGLLQQAQQANEVSLDRDIRALAQYLANTVFGIRVMSKMNPDQQVFTNVVDLALSVLA